jgi:hypothetical protein
MPGANAGLPSATGDSTRLPSSETLLLTFLDVFPPEKDPTEPEEEPTEEATEVFFFLFK